MSIAAGSLIGAFVDQAFDGTVLPLATAFFVCGVVALGCFLAAHRDYQAEPQPEPFEIA